MSFVVLWVVKMSLANCTTFLEHAHINYNLICTSQGRHLALETPDLVAPGYIPR